MRRNKQSGIQCRCTATQLAQIKALFQMPLQSAGRKWNIAGITAEEVRYYEKHIQASQSTEKGTLAEGFKH